MTKYERSNYPQIGIESLGNDILSTILDYFQKNEHSFVASLVCKKWNNMIQQNKYTYSFDMQEKMDVIGTII